MRKIIQRLAVWAFAIAIGAGMLVLPGDLPHAAAAGAAVTVSPEGGTLAAGSATRVDLRGSGFLSKQNGFGGIYVLFGWVDQSWRPSQGGKSGKDYQYVADDANKPVGYQLFVHFPGDSTASSANGGELRLDGTWSATLVIPGARITVADQSGASKTIDCTAVQCGIITIGAHGVTEPANETFTPVRFAQSAAPQTTTATPVAAAAAAAAPSASATTSAAPVASATATPTPVLTAGTASWKVSDVLFLVAGYVVALAVLALAAGAGGYLAVKSILLGVSPAARARVEGNRARKAARELARQEQKAARARQRQQRRAARASRNDEEDDLSPAAAFLRNPEGHLDGHGETHQDRGESA